MTDPSIPLPPREETILSDYIDYNGHMNVAFYVLIFDRATDALLEHAGLDEAYRERTNHSVFVAEMHVTYEQEAMEGERVRVRTRVLSSDGKRLCLFHEMFSVDGARLLATNEVMILHVDLISRRVALFCDDMAERLRALALVGQAADPPPQVGRYVGKARG